MKCTVLFIFLYFVSVTQCYQHKSNNLTTVPDVHRIKRQQQTWIWRDSDEEDKTRQGDTAGNSEEPNPCTIKPVKPNFNDGRRISEVKCLEYIWELKNRDDVKKNVEACLEYNRKKGIISLAPFVIGGSEAKPGEFPHMGALGWRAVEGTWLFKCGGALISSKFVLTAAHCTDISPRDTSVANTKPEIVRLGDRNIIDSFSFGQVPMDAEILRITAHPQYKPPKQYFDIALIELVSDVKFDKYVQPACLWSNNDVTSLGTKAYVTGWGYIDAARLKTPPTLQAAIVDIIDSKLCNNLLMYAFNRNFNGVQPNQLCAGVLAGGVDTCQGDSGGPLQVKIPLPIKTEGTMSYLTGVTSFGYGCARANSPGIYTRVSSFLNWIERIVWKK